MGTETIRNKAEELKGQFKEKVGELTDNEDLQAKGAFEKSQARGKQAIEDVKDHVSDAAQDVRDDLS
ncbi:MAG TPA: CsbD family protein [Aeromicrobium sp.]|nr:CsbD family protein [Aeromicrobium sp.]